MQARKSPGILRDYWIEFVLFIALSSILVTDCIDDQKKHELGVQICHPHRVLEISQTNGYAVCIDNDNKKILKEFK